MTHTTEVVEYKKLSNGQFAVIIRCCGNASTDWSHTMAAEVASDSTRRTASLDTARGACSALHQHALDAEAALLSEMGATQDHAL